jgi:hypothetical protein
LPYRPDLVGFMSNVRGLGRNIHQFWEVEVFFLFFSKQKVLGVFIVMILLIFGVFLLANYDF